MIYVSAIGLSGMPDKKSVVIKYLRHCKVGKIQDGRNLSEVKHKIHITFKTDS